GAGGRGGGATVGVLPLPATWRQAGYAIRRRAYARGRRLCLARSHAVTSREHPARILIVGEINVDFVFNGCHALPAPGKEVLADDFVMTPGSSSMICAMGLARLGNQVAFHGHLGADASGTFCLKAMRDAGIDVSSLRPSPALRTGVTASLSTPQDRALVTFPGAMAQLRAEDVDNAQ